jgi:hypothetical protein
MVETKDSAVTNGELKFSGLPDRKLDIPAAAFVDVAPASDWRLTRLRVAPDGIAVALSGRTSHLTVEGRNVIPTYLDQLDGRFGWARRAVQTIVLLVTSVVSLWTWVSTRGKEGKA